MDVSVIVCTYNRCQLLKGNLVALSRQVVTSDCQWEVIIIDNNCADATAQVVAEFANQFPSAIRRVVECKQGLSNARNRGIAESRGRYILFTDDDTRPAVDWVQRIWETFQISDCDAVGGKVDIMWPGARPAWFADELTSSLAGVDYGMCEIDLTSEHPPLGANMAFKRVVFERVGGFDPELGRVGSKLLGGEETDLFKRMSNAGLRGRYQPAALVGHVIEPHRVRKSYFRKIYFYGGQSRGRVYPTSSVRKIGGIPFFTLRQLSEKVISIFCSVFHSRPDQIFMTQLQAWWLLGFIYGCSTQPGTTKHSLS